MENATQTKNKLGTLGSTSLVLGNMIGSGIFLLPATLAFYGGISILGWFFSAIGALFLAKVFSGLSKEIPQSGGPYSYTREGFGEFAGFLVAWGYWISICATNAAIAVAFLGYMSVFFPILGTSEYLSIGVGLFTIWLLTWVNTRGIRTTGMIQIITTILKVIPLILIAVLGLFYIDWSNFLPFNISGKSDFQAIMETATLTFFAFLGMESATIPSEEVAEGGKTIAKATMRGTYFAIVIYILSSMVLIGVIPPETLQKSSAPFADAAILMWGNNAQYWVALGAVISTFGALNGWLLMQGQIPMSAAKDKMFPAIFGKKNEFGSPAIGIVFSSIIVSIILLLNFSKGLIKAFEFIMLLSTLSVLVPYLFSSATHILIFYKKGKKWFWVLGLLAFMFSIWMIVGSGAEVVLWGFILLMLGLPIYIFMKIKKEKE